jgi:hypothetical protein
VSKDQIRNTKKGRIRIVPVWFPLCTLFLVLCRPDERSDERETSAGQGGAKSLQRGKETQTRRHRRRVQDPCRHSDKQFIRQRQQRWRQQPGRRNCRQKGEEILETAAGDRLWPSEGGEGCEGGEDYSGRSDKERGVQEALLHPSDGAESAERELGHL